ncbi:MAG: hypothetical protein J7J01_01215 [Methanophagales archaeon]|nr:hypothetical protein [Methanophagales archaeon]
MRADEITEIAEIAEREGFTLTQYDKDKIKEAIKNALNECKSVVEHFKQLAEQNIPIIHTPSYIVAASFQRDLTDEEMSRLQLSKIFACRKVLNVCVTARTIFVETYIEHPDILPLARIYMITRDYETNRRDRC